MTPGWWVGVCECVCLSPARGCRVPVDLGRRVTTEVGALDPFLGPPTPTPRPPDLVCQQPQLEKPWPEVCSCSTSGQEFSSLSFHQWQAELVWEWGSRECWGVFKETRMSLVSCPVAGPCRQIGVSGGWEKGSLLLSGSSRPLDSLCRSVLASGGLQGVGTLGTTD